MACFDFSSSNLLLQGQVLRTSGDVELFLQMWLGEELKHASLDKPSQATLKQFLNDNKTEKEFKVGHGLFT